MQTQKEKKEHSILFAVLALCGCALLLYVGMLYFYLFLFSTGYIMDHYPVMSKILLFCGIPLILIGVIFFGIAKSDVYVAFGKNAFANEFSGRSIRYFFYFFVLLFVIYNFFCIYVYFFDFSGDVANLHRHIIRKR